LSESNAKDKTVIYEKQITLVMQMPSWIFASSHKSLFSSRNTYCL